MGICQASIAWAVLIKNNKEKKLEAKGKSRSKSLLCVAFDFITGLLVIGCI